MLREGKAVAIFARWPEPGRVMPLLTPRIGAEAAAQVYGAFIGDLIASMPLGSFDASLYCADHEEGFRKRFPDFPIQAQRGRGEGRRLHACFEEMLEYNPQGVIIGSSLPDLHPRMLEAAFEMLERRDVVIGPTERGGFYLLGMREPRDVFRGVDWGAPNMLVTLLENFEKAHLDYGFFPTRQKVETYEDLVSLRKRLLRSMAPLTFTMLQTLGVGQETKAVARR